MSKKYAFLLATVFLTHQTMVADDASKASAPATAGAAAATEKPKWTPEQVKIQEYMEELFTASKGVNAGGEVQKKARGRIETAMNWERIAIDCLGKKQWAAQSPKNRQKFRDLLHEVIAKTAYTRLDTFWDGANYTFDKIDIKGKEAHVVAKFLVKNSNVTLDYYLEREGSGWKVYDIAFEGFRYSTNINEQLMDFLREKGFPNLIEKLTKRLENLDKGKKS